MNFSKIKLKLKELQKTKRKKALKIDINETEKGILPKKGKTFLKLMRHKVMEKRTAKKNPKNRNFQSLFSEGLEIF